MPQAPLGEHVPRVATRASGGFPVRAKLQETPQRKSVQPVVIGRHWMRGDDRWYQRSGIHAIHSAAPSRPDDGHAGITEWPAPLAAVPASEIRRVISVIPRSQQIRAVRY